MLNTWGPNITNLMNPFQIKVNKLREKISHEKNLDYICPILPLVSALRLNSNMATILLLLEKD